MITRGSTQYKRVSSILYGNVFTLHRMDFSCFFIQMMIRMGFGGFIYLGFSDLDRGSVAAAF
jgi:hypothetical protein